MSVIKTVRSILSGDILLKHLNRKKILLIVFAFVLALVYVANHFHGVLIYREINNSEKHIEELRAESLAIQSELLKKTNRRGSVLELLDMKGSTLEEPKSPPRKIVYDMKNHGNRKKSKK